MSVALPPKIFDIIAPAIKGNVHVAREVRVTKFMKVFSGYFGCVVEKRKRNVFKVWPPKAGCGVWFWQRSPFIVCKPPNGRLARQDLYAIQKTLKNGYNWDHTTIVRGES